MRSFGPDELDYRGLIKELSSPPNYPTSAHIRNHLLAAYAAFTCPFDLSKQDQWKTYHEYRKGVQLMAIGDVPSHVLLQQSSNKDDDGNVRNDLDDDNGCLWSIVIVFPSHTPGWQELDKDVKKTTGIWHTKRLAIWLSSESSSRRSTGPVSIDNIPSASRAEEEMLWFIFHDVIPQASLQLAMHLGEEPGSQSQSELQLQSPNDAGLVVDLFAVNEAWVCLLRKWTSAGDEQIKLTRANPCMTFVKEEAEALNDIADFPPQYSVSTIESKEEMSLVQTSNSLTFPLWYVEQRKHISILVFDNDPPLPQTLDNTPPQPLSYPTKRQTGSPVAWAYAHDDLSLASLHVAEPYRRLGLGKYSVDAMARKLIQAQKQAVRLARCDDVPLLQTACLLDTEMHKGGSRLFFEQLGFKGIVIATWGSILVARPPSNPS
jgi:GNAT superfamily N-acetyltransferase